jgi:hypothetical protein
MQGFHKYQKSSKFCIRPQVAVPPIGAEVTLKLPFQSASQLSVQVKF